MKVAILTQAKYASGAEIITSELYSNMKENIRVFTGSEPAKNFYNNVNIKVNYIDGLAPLGSLSNNKIIAAIRVYKSLIKTRKKIKNFNPKYIHVNNVASLLYAVLSTIGLKIPILLQVHDYYSKAKIEKNFARILKKYPKLVVAVSNSVRNELISLGYSPVNTITVHNGIKFGEKPKFIQKFSEKELKIGFIASISEWKGLHILLEAAEILEKKGYYPNYEVVGPFLDEDYKKKIFDQIKKINISKVVFLGSRNDVRKLLCEFDILVHCSVEDDPFPTVILEGLHSRCAVIGSDSGGVPEIIKDGENGLLHITGSPTSLANAIEKLIKDNDLRKSLANNGYNRALSYLTLERFQREFFDNVNKFIFS